MIALANAFKPSLKSTLKTTKDIPGGAMILLAQQIHCQSGYKSAREDVGRKHGKNHCLREGNKQIAGDAVKEKHREEDNTDAECRDQGRHRNLGRAIQDRLTLTVPLLAKPLNILNRNRGIVYQDANG